MWLSACVHASFLSVFPRRGLELEEILDALISVLFNQFHHALEPVSTAEYEILESMAYLGHDRPAVVAFDIAERHLSPFMVVDHDLRMVNVPDLFQRNW